MKKIIKIYLYICLVGLAVIFVLGVIIALFPNLRNKPIEVKLEKTDSTVTQSKKEIPPYYLSYNNDSTISLQIDKLPNESYTATLRNKSGKRIKEIVVETRDFTGFYNSEHREYIDTVSFNSFNKDADTVILRKRHFDYKIERSKFYANILDVKFRR